MSTKCSAVFWLGISIIGFILLSAFSPASNLILNEQAHAVVDDRLKQEALAILQAKCNVCHRKQNPFMVFKENNISKRAKNIYRMVFIEQKMPKGNEIKLTNEESITLKKWLLTQNIH
ncbi:MAG: hypothetical protein AAFP02_13295 [Bacteroidota bacterium]